jgi:hypothetical protein
MIMKPAEGSYPKDHGYNTSNAIEQCTSKLPTDTFLWAALGSVVLALGLQATGHRGKANFVAHLAPTFLLLGVYDKMVNLNGPDSTEANNDA